MNFTERKVSINRAIAMLAKSGIEVDDGEAALILDFLYLMSKNRNTSEEVKNDETLKGNRTSEKYCETTVNQDF